MELCDLDYKILKLVKRKGPMDLTAIKSKFPKNTVSDLRLLELSRPPIIYPGHPGRVAGHPAGLHPGRDGTPGEKGGLMPAGKGRAP